LARIVPQTQSKDLRFDPVDEGFCYVTMSRPQDTTLGLSRRKLAA
jgi:hypothetical protein